MGIPLYVICCFSLLAFNIFSLYLIFVSLINMCLGVFLLGYTPVWDCLHFLDLLDFFLSHVREVSSYYLFKYFIRPFLFFFFFWDPYNLNVCMFNVVPEISERLSSFLFILFSLFCSMAEISTILSSRSLICSLPLLFCYWFLPVYFSFQLLSCSFLFVCSLVLLGLC